MADEDRAFALAREVYRMLGIELTPEESLHLVDLVERSAYAGGPGWDQFAAALRAFGVFHPRPDRRHREDHATPPAR